MSRRTFTGLVGASGLLLTMPGCSERHAEMGPDGMPLDGPYLMRLEDAVMVPMRDGVRMATDIYLPTKGTADLDGPWPVILERTPYGRNRPSRSERSLARADRGEKPGAGRRDLRATRLRSGLPGRARPLRQ